MTDAPTIMRLFFGPRPPRDPMTGLCRWCGNELDDLANPRRKYCCHSHRQRAYERRHGLKTGTTRSNPNRKNH